MSDGEFQIAEDEYDAFIPGNYFQGGKNLQYPTKPKSMTGIEKIAQERLEQKIKHGRSAKHDADHNPNGELVEAAIALIGQAPLAMPEEWDATICNYMIRKSYEERLVIAGALIAAEIDRLNFKE